MFWNIKGRTSLHCQKVLEIHGYGWAYLSCRENCMLLIATANQSVYFSFSMANYSWKLHKKHSIKLQHKKSDDFTEHYIIRYLSARKLVLSPGSHILLTVTPFYRPRTIYHIVCLEVDTILETLFEMCCTIPRLSNIPEHNSLSGPASIPEILTLY